jgi:hypothetical protein
MRGVADCGVIRSYLRVELKIAERNLRANGETKLV